MNKDEGMLEWYNTNELKDDKPIADGFRVVHNNVNCMYDFKTLSKDNNSVSDRPLNYFVNMTAHEVLDCINEDYFVKNEDIIGRTILVCYPLKNVRFVKNIDY